MTICKQCGVELEEGMVSCPLCNTSTSNRAHSQLDVTREEFQSHPRQEKKHLMQKILWQITAVLLLSGVIATFIINMAVVGSITWSIYPISICLIVLAYASLAAFWRTRLIYQMLGGWFISSLLLVLVNRYAQGEWPLLLALPILAVINVIGIILYFVLGRLKTKGLNVLAMVFVSLAGASLVIEAIISRYADGVITLGWSIIVAACLLPVTAAILFMYFRTRNNPDLQKIFHT